MDQKRYCVQARSLPVNNALYGSSAVSREQGPLHRRPGVVKNKQGSSHGSERMWVKKLVHKNNIRFGTWNVGTLTGKLMEIGDTMIRRRINIMCLQETKWVGEKARELDSLGFKLWYTGKNRSRNGVGIIADKHWSKEVVDVKRIGDRIIALKFIVDRETFNVISAYAPQVGLEESIKVKFWEDLEGLIQNIPLSEKIFLGGDLNGHVGKTSEGFEGVHGGYGIGEANGEGKVILESALSLDLVIANTCFKKREEHLIMYKSGTRRSQIDFFFIRKADRKLCMDCKVIPGESLTSQHRVLVMDIRVRRKLNKTKPFQFVRIKWWKLKEEKQGIFRQKVLEESFWETQGNANDMWNEVANRIRIIAKQTLGVSKGFGPKGKESWWWDDIVQQKIRVKRDCYKTWSLCKNEDNWNNYKIAKQNSKKAVSEAKNNAFNNLYQSLGTKVGEQNMYRLAKSRARKTKDLDQIRCIKNERGEVLVTEGDIKERWKNYFHNLFNEGN